MARESIASALWRLNRKAPWAIALLLVLNLAIYGYDETVLAKRLQAMEVEYREKEAQLRIASGVKGGRQDPHRAFNEAEEELKQFRYSIDHKSRFSHLIAEIDELSRKAGLEIESVSYEKGQSPELDLINYDLLFNVIGNYQQLKTFIFSLEKSSRIISIGEIALQHEGDEEGANVRLSLRLSTYFRAGAA